MALEKHALLLGWSRASCLPRFQAPHDNGIPLGITTLGRIPPNYSDKTVDLGDLPLGTL